jgi:hypothetical protein
MARITQGKQHKTSKYNLNATTRDHKVLSDKEKDINSFGVKDAMTGEYPTVDNQHPEMALPYLIPVAISPLKIDKLDKPLRSSDLILDAEKIGFIVNHLELPLYGKGKWGKPRKLNNSELPQGYPFFGKSEDPLDERLAKLLATKSKLVELTSLIKHKAEKFSDPVKFDEWDDADKLTIQRTQYFGRFLSIPASTDLIDVSYPKRFLEILDEVCKDYISSTESEMPSRTEALIRIQDAQETAIGGPSFASSGVDDYGNDYNAKRLITLADMPTPDYSIDPSYFLEQVYNWGEQLGLPDGSMAFASAISYRQGAKGHKPQSLWYFNGSEFVADYEAMSMESNQRVVYPAPHALNVVLTPIVYQMKTFRRKRLGMYHTPELMTEYIPRLNSQGSYSYESDFSGYDRTISNQIMRYAMMRLGQFAKKYKWEYKLFEMWLETTGVIFPNFLAADPEYVTYFKEGVSLLSGILPTSEVGSLISVASNLYALEPQFPNIVSQWRSGKFVILVQSDDVLFTTTKKLDEESFEHMMQTISLTAKLKEGNMFLKKLLPVGTLSKFVGKFPLAGTPLLSRQLIQTFFNENSYEGKPDAIVRLALKSRSEGLNTHPAFDKEFDDAWKAILASHEIFNTEGVIDTLYDGVLSLSDNDKLEVLKYSENDTGLAWLSKIYNRAESDPKARQMLQEMIKIGFNMDQFEDTAISQRKAYLTAMFTEPSKHSRDNMMKILSWLGN